MKKSLRQQLNDLIRARGEVSYNEIKDKCESGYFGAYYRITTAERRLRKSESPAIEAVIKDGYIKSYKLVEPIKYREVVAVHPVNGDKIIIKLPI